MRGTRRNQLLPALTSAWLLACGSAQAAPRDVSCADCHLQEGKEFAASVHMAPPNVLRAINPRHNPTQETLNRLLRPFRLRLSLAPSRADAKRRPEHCRSGEAVPPT